MKKHECRCICREENVPCNHCSAYCRPYEDAKCPYPDCPKVKYKDCSTHGVMTTTTEKGWELEFSSEFDSRFYGRPKEVPMNPDKIKALIKKTRQEAYSDGYKQGRFNTAADKLNLPE